MGTKKNKEKIKLKAETQRLSTALKQALPTMKRLANKKTRGMS